MMQDFLFRFGQNMASRRNQTLGVLAGLFGAIVIAWIIVNAVLSIGFFGLVISAPLVLWGTTKIPQLAWFWGASADSVDTEAAKRSSTDNETSQGGEEDHDEDDGLEHIPMPDPATIIHGSPQIQDGRIAKGCERVRETPVGTRIVRLTPNEAVLEVKSVIRFWCWFAPMIWMTFAVIGGFVGSAVGLEASFNQRGSSNPLPYIFWGAAIPFGFFTFFAVSSYFANRPWVSITIDGDSIRYGNRLFDRRFSSGVQMGYKTSEADLRASFTDDRFGVTRIRLTYGRWGEDLKYMVNSYHVAEIVIWMNEIIDSVGAPPPPRYDPYGGRKIELL